MAKYLTDKFIPDESKPNDNNDAEFGDSEYAEDVDELEEIFAEPPDVKKKRENLNTKLQVICDNAEE